MPVKPEPTSQSAAPGANMSIWTAEPQLGTQPGQTYVGRIFVEVWDKDARLVSLGDANILKSIALSTLTDDVAALPQAAVPWTDEPATGTLPGQTFLGRVVVEVWDGRGIVAISGSDPALLEHARHRLTV